MMCYNSHIMTARALLGWLPILALAGCTTSTGASPLLGTDDPSADPMPVFALVDVNPTSASYMQSVSTDHHLGRVGAWYFGHAT